ncbi:MAG TPA: VOC family protein [Candidatus Saccharimonadales bacterium]|nr:VOC family protein [Candidatus Saccharimonadales bacterium]
MYVDNFDSFFSQAVKEGAKELQPPQDMFYGARTIMLEDPFGHLWVFLQQLEDMDPKTIRAIGESLLQRSVPNELS